MEKLQNTSEFEKNTETLALKYLEKGRDFDVVHTKYGLEVLKEEKEKNKGFHRPRVREFWRFKKTFKK